MGDCHEKSSFYRFRSVCSDLGHGSLSGPRRQNCDSTSPTITNCIVRANDAAYGGGIYCNEASPRVVNCTIEENESVWNGAGIYCVDSSPTVANCRFYYNDNEYGRGGGLYFEHSSPTIMNCILWEDSAPSGPEIAIDASTLMVSNSDVQGEEAAAILFSGTLEWLDGNIDLDPLFVDPAGLDGYIGTEDDDLHIGRGSPCIDAGNPALLYNDLCFPPSKGLERNDMGAYGGPEACGWLSCWDADGDGYEDEACGGDDCRDSNPQIHPGAWEFCDGVDTDCDGALSWDEEDTDGDGWMICTEDCDDMDARVHPGHDEVCTDGKDNDCDGYLDMDDPDCGGCWDVDGDGYDEQWCGGSDCDDSDPDVNPGAEEDCENGIDDDCDGLADSEDPECVTLEMAAYYRTGMFNLYFTLSTPEDPATWATYMILTYPAINILPLWSIPLSTIYPPIDIPVEFPFPSSGWVGIYSCLTSESGMQVYQLEWVDTGL